MYIYIHIHIHAHILVRPTSSNTDKHSFATLLPSRLDIPVRSRTHRQLKLKWHFSASDRAPSSAWVGASNLASPLGFFKNNIYIMVLWKQRGEAKIIKRPNFLDGSGWFQMVLESQITSTSKWRTGSQHDETTKQHLPWLPSVGPVHQPVVTLISYRCQEALEKSVALESMDFCWLGTFHVTNHSFVYQTDWTRVSVGLKARLFGLHGPNMRRHGPQPKHPWHFATMCFTPLWQVSQNINLAAIDVLGWKNPRMELRYNR
jgi:hypothetical protein